MGEALVLLIACRDDGAEPSPRASCAPRAPGALAPAARGPARSPVSAGRSNHGAHEIPHRSHMHPRSRRRARASPGGGDPARHLAARRRALPSRQSARGRTTAGESGPGCRSERPTRRSARPQAASGPAEVRAAQAAAAGRPTCPTSSARGDWGRSSPSETASCAVASGAGLPWCDVTRSLRREWLRQPATSSGRWGSRSKWPSSPRKLPAKSARAGVPLRPDPVPVDGW
jgi:hypothetical protein